MHMNDPDGKPYYHSEEQIEAAKLTSEGKKWGNANCRNLECGHRWVAIFMPESNSRLECPECGRPTGTVIQPSHPL